MELVNHSRQMGCENTNLSVKDIQFIYSETHTGPKFNNIVIAFVRTTIGLFDILFHSNGDLLKQHESRPTVIKIEKFYEKNFAGIIIDNSPAWAMEINQ